MAIPSNSPTAPSPVTGTGTLTFSGGRSPSVRDPEIRQRILNEVLDFAAETLPDCELAGWCESPITGMNGNLEYLAGWTRKGTGQS